MRKKIGILSTGWNDEYQMNLLRGITSASAQYDFDTLSFASCNIDFSVKAQNLCSHNIFNLISDECVDAVILIPNSIFYEDIIKSIMTHATQLTVPVICIDYEHESLMSIGTDNYSSARILVEHLFEGKTPKHPACITGISFNPESRARVQAFKDVVTKYLGGYDEDYIFTGNFQNAAGQAAAQHWHTSGKEYPDAVFCCNDLMAIGFLETSQGLGYRVPEDVRIVGFDNSDWGRTLHTPLTSIQCSIEKLGNKAIEIINDIFSGKTPKQHEKLIGTPFFRKSSSVSDTATEDSDFTNHWVPFQSNLSTLFLANLMIEEFSFCNSLNDFMETLQDVVLKFPCEEFYLCFTKDQMDSMGIPFHEESERFGYMLEGYSSHMYMLIHYENKEFHKPQIFETKKILPVLETERNKRTDYVLLPLYYMGRTHGYCVLGNCQESAYTGAFQTLTSLLSYGVNSIYLKHELEEKAKTLEYLHERDSMTETYNRLGFKKHSQEMLRDCVKRGEQMMVLFADMDGMKAINDQLGHEEGDNAICAFSSILKQNCIHGEIVSRFGGDEMLVFGIGYSDELAKDFIERFQLALDRYNSSNPLYSLKVSMGYEIFTPDSTTNLEDCVSIADAKMYTEKNERKKKMIAQGIPVR